MNTEELQTTRLDLLLFKLHPAESPDREGLQSGDGTDAVGWS